MRILDRYLLREFMVAFSLAMLFFIAIFVVVDLFEKIDTFIDYKASPLAVAQFYVYGIPYIIILVLPIALLLSCFLTFGQMARRNELMAMGVSGIDFLRVMAPVLVLAFVCCGFSLAMGELIVPACNKAKEDTLRTVIKKQPPSSTTRRANVNYLGAGGRIFLIKLYDSVDKSMKEVVIQEFGNNTLERRIDAAEARWDGTQWVFENGMIRSFVGGVERASQFSTLTIPGLKERPEDFAKQEADPEEMNFVQLTRYVSRVKDSGGRIQKYLVELQMKLAFPLTNIIVTLVGASLSTRVRRGTLALGFGLSLFISFTYYGFIKTGQALGHSGALPPFVAAWMGNVFFGGLGVFLLLKARR